MQHSQNTTPQHIEYTTKHTITDNELLPSINSIQGNSILEMKYQNTQNKPRKEHYNSCRKTKHCVLPEQKINQKTRHKKPVEKF